MKTTFALLTGGAIAFGSLAMAPTVEAAVRYYGQERYYDAVPVVLRFRESPTYAPDRPAPRFYNTQAVRTFRMDRAGRFEPRFTALGGSRRPAFEFVGVLAMQGLKNTGLAVAILAAISASPLYGQHEPRNAPSTRPGCPPNGTARPNSGETTGRAPLSDRLSESKGVICPPEGVDPGIVEKPPPTKAPMPVIPPPGNARAAVRVPSRNKSRGGGTVAGRPAAQPSPDGLRLIKLSLVCSGGCHRLLRKHPGWRI
jgi:hypothetical protein